MKHLLAGTGLLLLLSSPSIMAAYHHRVPLRVEFSTTEIQDVLKRTVSFSRTEVREDNTPMTYDGGFLGRDFKVDPSVHSFHAVPFKLDEAGMGDCWAQIEDDEAGMRHLLELQCDNDSYAEGGSTGVTATLDKVTQTYHILGYKKNRPNAEENWEKDFGKKFTIDDIQWD